jgi:glycosyltransferase involved in cell wall biosynthesis
MTTDKNSIVSKKKRIVLLAPVYTRTISGAAYMAQLLRDSRFAEQFELTHINTRFVDSVADLEKISPGKVVLFLKYLCLLVWTLLTKHPDAVIICPAFSKGAFLKDSIYTLISSVFFRRKVIWWTHASGARRLFDASPVWVQRYMRWITQSVYRVVTVGSRQREEYYFACSPEQVLTINNGSPAREFSLNRFHGRRNVRVLYLSNLEITKGWKVLLEAARQICDVRQNVYFDFYGNPALNSPLEAIHEAFAEDGCGNRITYHGPAFGEDKQRAFDEADIFCFPTFFPHEAFSVVVLEAMNAALPLVTTDHASLRDAVVDGQGGVLVPKNDVTTLAAALLRLVDDGELRHRMGGFNQHRFYDLFTVDEYVNRWIEFVSRQV